MTKRRGTSRATAPIADPGTAAAHRCPSCLHRYASPAGLPAEPFAPFTENVRCPECGAETPAGTRMILGGALLADDPNASRWTRVVAPWMRVVLLFVLLVVCLLVVKGAISGWLPRTFVGTFGLPPPTSSGFTVTKGAFGFALLGSIAGIGWSSYRLLRDHLVPALGSSGHGDRGEASRSTWLIDREGLRISRLRGLRLCPGDGTLQPIATAASSQPVIDEEHEHGHAVKLEAVLSSEGHAKSPLHVDARRLRRVRVAGRRWPDMKALSEDDERADSATAAPPELRLRVEDRPEKEAASTVASATLAALGHCAAPGATETLAGSIADGDVKARVRRDRRSARLEKLVSAAVLLMLLLLASAAALAILALASGPSWAGPACIGCGAGAVGSCIIVAFASSAGFPLPFGRHPSIGRWIAVPGALCAVVESDEHDRAQALAISATTIKRLALALDVKESAHGTWVSLGWSHSGRAADRVPVMELRVDLPPAEASAAAERLLAVACREAATGDPAAAPSAE